MEEYTSHDLGDVGVDHVLGRRLKRLKSPPIIQGPSTVRMYAMSGKKCPFRVKVRFVNRIFCMG